MVSTVMQETVIYMHLSMTFNPCGHNYNNYCYEVMSCYGLVCYQRQYRLYLKMEKTTFHI